MNKKLSFSLTLLSVAIATGCSTNIKESDEYISLQNQYQDTQQARLSAETELQKLLAKQNGVNSSLLPPNPKTGECYARVVIPAKYELKEQTVETTPERQITKTRPPQYQWVDQSILIKEAYEKLEVVPATYKMIQEQVLISEAGEKLSPVSAKYETVTEQILIKPAHTIWKKGRGPIEKIDASTGEIMCLVEVPAEYQTIKKQVLVSPEKVVRTEIPAKYKTISKRVVDQPAATRTVVVPAEYTTIRVRKVVEEAQQNKETLPAQYQTISQSIKTADAYLEWRPILCETNTKPALISELQTTLQKKGYNPGPIDGVIGRETMSAVVNYQKDNKLPSGKLTIQTLKSLGIRL